MIPLPTIKRAGSINLWYELFAQTFHPGDGAMLNIALSEILAKLPVAKLQAETREFTEPMTAVLPDKRLREVVCVSVQNILATETPVIAAMSRSGSRTEYFEDKTA